MTGASQTLSAAFWPTEHVESASEAFSERNLDLNDWLFS